MLNSPNLQHFIAFFVVSSVSGQSHVAPPLKSGKFKFKFELANQEGLPFNAYFFPTHQNNVHLMHHDVLWTYASIRHIYSILLQC